MVGTQKRMVCIMYAYTYIHTQRAHWNKVDSHRIARVKNRSKPLNMVFEWNKRTLLFFCTKMIFSLFLCMYLIYWLVCRLCSLLIEHKIGHRIIRLYLMFFSLTIMKPKNEEKECWTKRGNKRQEFLRITMWYSWLTKYTHSYIWFNHLSFSIIIIIIKHRILFHAILLISFLVWFFIFLCLYLHSSLMESNNKDQNDYLQEFRALRVNKFMDEVFSSFFLCKTTPNLPESNTHSIKFTIKLRYVNVDVTWMNKQTKAKKTCLSHMPKPIWNSYLLALPLETESAM